MANIYPQVIVFDPTSVGLVGMTGNDQTWTGTNTFRNLLELSGTVSQSLLFNHTDAAGVANTTLGAVQFKDGTTILAQFTGITGATDATTGEFRIQTYNGTSLGSRFIIKGNGDVSIADNVVPTGKLFVQGNEDNEVIVARSNATQTENIIEVQTSAGSTLGGFSSIGTIGAGTAPSTTRGVNIVFTSDQTSVRGVLSNPTCSVATGATFYGIDNTPYYTGIGGTLTDFYGITMNPRVRAAATSAVTRIAALWVQYANESTAGAVVGTGYGLRILNPTATGTITTNYALRIEDQTNGGTNYAIYTNAGDSRFGDDVILNGADSDKLWFGAGKDMSIYYDGTSGYIKTSDVGASDLHITTGTAKTLVLDTPVYKDINIAGALLVGNPTVTPGEVKFLDETGTDTGIYTYGFKVDEGVHGGFEIQHDYKEGTDLHFHVHWQGIAAPTGTDNVQWRLTYIVARDGETLNAAVTIDSPDTAIDTRYKCYRTDFTAITGTNYKIGDQFMFSLFRVASTGDAYAGDALIQTAGIHYQCDTIGSRAIGTK